MGSSRSADESSLLQVPDQIPIFPLPNVVFFPKTYLPLHIFEPRYRAMIDDTVGRNACIGMALLKEGWEQDYEHNPPIYGVGCVGRLVRVDGLPDGRYNIILQGLARYTVREEFYDKSYRRARIEVKRDHVEPLDSRLRAELMALVRQEVDRRQDQHDWRRVLESKASDEVLINTLASWLDLTPVEKQFLLEAESLRQRARRLNDLLQFRRHESGGLMGWG